MIEKILFAIYLFSAVYCAGSMTVLQLQHFALYPKVGQEAFKDYLIANNKAAFIPSILPALLVFITTGILLFIRPPFMESSIAWISFTMNLINIASSFIWQARIHSQLANIGYNEPLIQRLISTNWIRTIALFAQALLAVNCVMSVV